uniref:Uncharacterized protein n=1 Tax=Sparus aurata TaxID=8175 RepID=A0A671X2S9_SPAAU
MSATRVFLTLMERLGFSQFYLQGGDFGCGVNDSPVGSAASILEKFSTATDLSYRNLMDGWQERKFSLEELLTDVLIYWAAGSIVSSMRFYKENFKSNPTNRVDVTHCDKCHLDTSAFVFAVFDDTGAPMTFTGSKKAVHCINPVNMLIQNILLCLMSLKS